MSFKDHPKSKGANFKIKKPLNMELEEGDRPNIVTRFNQKNDNNSGFRTMHSMRNVDSEVQVRVE